MIMAHDSKLTLVSNDFPQTDTSKETLKDQVSLKEDMIPMHGGVSVSSGEKEKELHVDEASRRDREETREQLDTPPAENVMTQPTVDTSSVNSIEVSMPASVVPAPSLETMASNKGSTTSDSMQHLPKGSEYSIEKVLGQTTTSILKEAELEASNLMNEEASPDASEVDYQDNLHSLLNCRICQLFVRTVDRLLDKSEEMMDQYLPLTEEEISNLKQAVEELDISSVDHQKSACFNRITALSSRLRQRAYMMALGKLRLARRSTLSNLSQLHQTLDLIEHAQQGPQPECHKSHERLNEICIQWTQQRESVGEMTVLAVSCCQHEAGMPLPANGNMREAGMPLPADKNTVEAGVPLAANKNIVEVGMPLTADENTVETGTPFTADKKSVEAGVPLAANENIVEVGVPLTAEENTVEAGVPFTADKKSVEAGMPLAANENIVEVGMPLTADENTVETGMPFTADKKSVEAGVALAANENIVEVGVPFAADENTVGAGVPPARARSTSEVGISPLAIDGSTMETAVAFGKDHSSDDAQMIFSIPGCREENGFPSTEVESKTLEMSRVLTLDLQGSYRNLLANLKDLPFDLKRKLYQTYQHLAELHTNFAMAQSFADLSSSILEKGLEIMGEAQEAIDAVMEFAFQNPTGMWDMDPPPAPATTEMPSAQGEEWDILKIQAAHDPKGCDESDL